MKTTKSKQHHSKLHPSIRAARAVVLGSAECWDLEIDHSDLDSQMYRIERSPRQENL